MLQRLKNPGTIIAITSSIILIGTIWGYFDNILSEQIVATVQALCSIGVLLGILNDPSTPGLDNPLILLIKK